MQVGTVAKGALLGRGWSVTVEQAHSISAQLCRDERVARIGVGFDIGQVRIRPVDSKDPSTRSSATAGCLSHSNDMGRMPTSPAASEPPRADPGGGLSATARVDAPQCRRGPAC
jgi:hypothetical protein